MSKNIIKMYSHNGLEVSVVEIYEKDREQSLDYFFETYEEAKADMKFQNRVNEVAGTSSIKRDIKEINDSLKNHKDWLDLYEERIAKLNKRIENQEKKHKKFALSHILTTAVIGVLLLILANINS